MCIRRSFSFIFCHQLKWLESSDSQVHVLPLCTCGNRYVCSWLREVSAGSCYILMHALGLGEWRECSERNVSSWLWTTDHLQLLRCTFLQHVPLTNLDIREIGRCPAVCLCVLKSILVLEKAARVSTFVLGCRNEPSTAS